MADSDGISIHVDWPSDSENWPGGYVNVFALTTTPWEVTIRAGHMILPAEQERPAHIEAVPDPVARLVMSPVAAKQLLLFLAEQVRGIEAANGTIAIPGGRE
jgi:hypothetical protein